MFTTRPGTPAPTSAVGGLRMSVDLAAWPPRPAALSTEPMVTVPTMPSSSTVMSAPVSGWMALMTLPFGPMTSPILSIGISKRDDLRGGLADLGSGLGDRGVHDLEDLQAGLAGLLQRLGQHVGREAVDLGVELQGGDEVGGAGDLEVHVAEGVLGAEDVGEGGVLALGVDQAHGDAGHRAP